MVLYEVATSRVPFAAEHRELGESEVVSRIIGGMRPRLEISGDSVAGANDSNNAFSYGRAPSLGNGNSNSSSSSGHRGSPPLASATTTASSSGSNSENVLVDMIRALWHDNPHERPSAAHVARTLGHEVLSYLPVNMIPSLSQTSAPLGINKNGGGLSLAPHMASSPPKSSPPKASPRSSSSQSSSSSFLATSPPAAARYMPSGRTSGQLQTPLLSASVAAINR
jgi:hypothetical protein